MNDWQRGRKSFLLLVVLSNSGVAIATPYPAFSSY